MDPQAVTAIPWWKSRILQGLLAIVVSQVTARLVKNYGVDMLGLTNADIVSWLMDAISALGVYWTTHARVAPAIPIPPVVTGTQATADRINAIQETPCDPSSTPPASASPPAAP